MPATKNLCAQISLELHQKISEAREESGLTTAQYITELLTEYFKMKENGGNITMTNNTTRTLAFQISEELFQRIKAHLERESARLGRKVTQREFVLGVIEGALNMAEPMDVDEGYVGPCEAQPEGGDIQPQEEDNPAALGA
ncbi:translation initiation factor 2 [uncultured Oscillibacter sp.]|uniref:translation initiation factor 2 n=1 Tax=uncultured Oscillibacter sp. TaxID=876091 RepID=UPI0025E1D687|nr:translation initiation factor 2 [uncultured Oscillibacter sp.]